jgi:zinc protease
MYAKFTRLLCACLLLLSGATLAGPKIQTWTEPNGSRVYFLPAESLPMVDIRVVFDAGSARDGTRFGLANLTSGLLDTGAASWNADTIAQRLEGVGARLGSGVSRDSAWLSLRTLTEPRLFDQALETAHEILVHPAFNDADFQREKKNLLLGLKQREESPADLAGISFFQNLYGDHPYAHPKDGVLDTAQALSRQDLLDFYRQYYVARNALVVVVGAVDRAGAEKLVKRLLQDLPEGEKPAAIPPVANLQGAKSLRRNFPSAQTHVYAGVPGMKVGDPDYFPLYVGNHILGGSGLVSRIAEEVREKRGLAYSAYSYFYPYRETGPFILGLQTRNDQADEALKVLVKTLRDFIDQGPKPQELEDAKKNITGGFPLRLDSNSKLTEQLASIAFYGQPLDYLDTFIAKVEAVSAEDVRKAFHSRIHPEQLLTVLVGGAPREK